MKAKAPVTYIPDSIRIQRAYAVNGQSIGFLSSGHDSRTVPFVTCVVTTERGTESEIESLLEKLIGRQETTDKLVTPNYGRTYCDITITDKRSDDTPDRFLITDHKNNSKALRNATEVEVRQFLRSYLHGTKPLSPVVISFINGHQIVDARAPLPV